jgi:CO/xanthine dehydrogenase Mo-binding subunit
MFSTVTKSINRIDGYEKITGRAIFGADLNLFGQLYARTVYANIPHAEIVDIDTSEAQKVNGVVCIITAVDVDAKNKMFGRFPVLAEKTVKYVGDGVAVVAAENPESAAEGAGLIKVKYRELPGIFSIDDSISGDAAPIHQDMEDNYIEDSIYRMRLGDVGSGFNDAKYILNENYRTGFVDQAYIEPEAVLALLDPYNSGVIIHGTFQNPYSVRENVAAALGLPISQVRIIQTVIGGSFGGKDESVMFMAARCAILAMKTKRPVKMVLSREESFLESCKRHPYFSKYRIGADKDGFITTVNASICSRGGAYNNKAIFANWRSSVHAAGAYYVPNVKTDTSSVYTNTVYGGAYRGFSAPQTVYAVESAVDELSYKCGISPLDIRLKNCLKPGDQIPTGQYLVPGMMPANLTQIITEVSRKSNFQRKWADYDKLRKAEIDGGKIALDSSSDGIRRGIGIACTFRGTGLGGEGIDTASATVTMEKDGCVNIQSGMSEIGQGIRTSHAQIVSEVLGVSFDRMTFSTTDTAVVMDSGPTVASRGLLAGGNAMKIAAESLRTRIFKVASEELGCSSNEVEAKDNVVYNRNSPETQLDYPDLLRTCVFGYGISLSAQGWYSPGPEKLDHETGHGKAYPSYIFGALVAEVKVDTGTGFVEVEKITSAYELGRAINPSIAKGQLIGGIVQGLGYAIMEEMDTDSGYFNTNNFDDYMIPGSEDIPEIDVVLFETDDNIGPYGAKGVGEVGVEMVAPAIGNAIFNASGKRIRELPFNLERVKLGKNLPSRRK